MAAELRTYGDLAIREDVVLNAVEILTAQENQISNMLQKTRAIAPTHIYLRDTLRTAGSIAVEESADFTPSANSTPTRGANVVEQLGLNFKVSRMQQAVQHYHGENEKERQTQKALKDFGNSLEFDLVRSTLVSGVSGTVAKMAGLIANISKSTNYTTHTSTTVLVASILDGLMKLNWDNSNGELATDLFVGSFLRNVMDQFAQKSNVVVNTGGISAIVKTVSTYETAFGTVRFHKHRYIYVSGTDPHSRILAIRPEKHAVAWLEMPYVDTTLARSGPYDNRAIVGSLTLETRNQDSNWFAAGFVQ